MPKKAKTRGWAQVIAVIPAYVTGVTVIRRICATRGTPNLPSGPAQRTTTMRKLMFIVSTIAAF